MISFLSAASFWWLAPAFAAIILLYLMKMRRQEMQAPALFLWPRITSDVRANAPMQRLRISLLLILQLIAAALIVLALTGPIRAVRGLLGSTTVVVLDNSASMGASDIRPSRFDAAVGRIVSMIQSLSGSDRLAVIEAGSATRVVFPLSSDKSLMLRAIRSVTRSDATPDVGDALRLAAALAAGHSRSTVIVLSDGDFPAVADFSIGKAKLIYEPIGKSSQNVAITTFDSALSPSGQDQCFLALHNYGPASANATLSLKIDGALFDARDISVPPGQTVTRSYVVPPNASTAEAAVTAPGDILAADNRAVLYLQASQGVRTLLVTQGDLFLERALSLNPVVRLERAAQLPDVERAGSPGKGAYDLVVFDNVPPVPVKAPAVWSLGIPGSQYGVVDAGMVARPAVLDWAHDDPILRYVDLRGTAIDRAHRVLTPPGSPARVLATGAAGPMIVTQSAFGRRSLYTSWSVLDSDFPLRVAFPVFVANAVDWLTRETQRAKHGEVRLMASPGKPFAISTHGQVSELIAPDGTKSMLTAPAGLAVVRGADRVGEYRVAGGGQDVRIAVNLLDQDASDVHPRPSINLAGSTVAARPGREFTLVELWRSVVIAALCVLAAEWLVYVRRS